eukprot:2867291-Amphidinium_carterae.1
MSGSSRELAPEKVMALSSTRLATLICSWPTTLEPLQKKAKDHSNKKSYRLIPQKLSCVAVVLYRLLILGRTTCVLRCVAP